jgi:hypothetical protein
MPPSNVLDIPLSTVLEMQVLAGLCLLAMAITFSRRDPSEPFFRHIEKLGSKLANRRAASCVAIVAGVLVVRVALFSLWSIPRPRIQDEFSYLLGGETLALGRLTNPSPHLWRFFEAPHILVTPSFQSRYPPGQAIALAAGKVLLGHPWFGVLLSCALMSAAICWMLQGWMPARWALLGGLLSLVRLSIYSYWMNSYWGGAVAAIGGCLVMGAFPRIIRRRQFGWAWAMGAGLVILANTRPLEGAISSVPVGVALLHWIFKEDKAATLRKRFWRVAGPIAVCVAVGGVFTCYYNYRVTGHALDLPHREFARQYAHVPVLLTGKMDDRKIVYSNNDMEYQYADWEPATVKGMQAYYLFSRWSYLASADHSTIGLLLAIPLLMIPLTLRDRRIRLMLVCLAIMALIMLAENSASLHYAAPQIGAFFGLLVQCIRHMRAGSNMRLRKAGRFLTRTLPVASVICFCGFGISLAARHAWAEPFTPIQHRPEAEATLQGLCNGKAIVFVRYSFNPRWIFAFEDWNYNPPDLANAPVLWVHDMGPEENDKLLREYPDRTPFYGTIDYTKGPNAQPQFALYHVEPLLLQGGNATRPVEGNPPTESR